MPFMMTKHWIHAGLALLLLAACSRETAPHISDARIVLPPPGMQMAAAYMELHNGSHQHLAIGNISCPAFSMVEVHETRIVDGMSRMREVENLSIPPGGSVKLVPGGMHLMLMGYRKDPSQFKNLPITIDLIAEDGTESIVEIRAPVLSSASDG